MFYLPSERALYEYEQESLYFLSLVRTAKMRFFRKPITQLDFTFREYQKFMASRSYPFRIEKQIISRCKRR